MKKIFSIFLVLIMSISFISVIAQEETAASPYLVDTLSGDWIDFQFQLDNQVYQLPMPVAIFLEDGWTLAEPDSLLEPNQYSFSQKLSKGDMVLNVQILNLSLDVLPATECLIGQISVKGEDAEKGNFTFLLPGNVGFESTQEDILTIFGVPKNTYEGSLYETATYSTETYSSTKLYYDLDSKKVIEVETRSFSTPKGYNDEAEAAAVEVPEETIAYKPAAQLGDDILAFNVSIDDVIYTLPGSFKFFEENGWKLATKDTSKIPAKSSQGRISLLYSGGYDMDVRFVNPTNKGNIVENLFVSTLTFEKGFPGKVELPGGITLGMSHDDLKAAVEGFGLTEEQLKVNESSSYVSYNLREKVLQDITITVSTETETVTRIEISNNTTTLNIE